MDLPLSVIGNMGFYWTYLNLNNFHSNFECFWKKHSDLMKRLFFHLNGHKMGSLKFSEVSKLLNVYFNNETSWRQAEIGSKKICYLELLVCKPNQKSPFVSQSFQLPFWNIGRFLRLGLESYISWNIRRFFGVAYFIFQVQKVTSWNITEI